MTLIKLKKIIISAFMKTKSWEEIEYFDDIWQNRVAKMATYLSPNTSIMDLGCGKMYLRSYLINNTYIPVDYKKRDADTIVCDFNKKEFPNFKADICFISGCMEYVEDYVWFINKICQHSNKVILSYCTTNEFPNLTSRKINAWVNHLSNEKITTLFQNNSFNLKGISYTQNRDQIFIFEKL